MARQVFFLGIARTAARESSRLLRIWIEIRDRGRKVWREVPKAIQQRILCAVALINAMEKGDRLAIESAYLRLQSVDDPILESIARSALQFKDAVQSELSKLISGGLNKTKVVLWWDGNRFSPALYCEDIARPVFTFAACCA